VARAAPHPHGLPRLTDRGVLEVHPRQLERGVLNDGKQITYAFGLEIGEYRGLPMVEHSGSTGGYRTDLTRFP